MGEPVHVISDARYSKLESISLKSRKNLKRVLIIQMLFQGLGFKENFIGCWNYI